jgi:DNA-binding Lrp family transcriptional regulator|tara:strand:+ start:7433 stop:7750 length:318 start_codon:yes stop_codon:yes gene_type:complete
VGEVNIDATLIQDVAQVDSKGTNNVVELSNSEQPLREVAIAVGITERAVQRIISELESAGYLERKKIGRQNSYTLHTDIKLRHSLEEHTTIGEILDVVVDQEPSK